MKKVFSSLIVGLILLQCLFGFSACSSLTPEEKDYLEAAKIFDANYKEISIEEYNKLYEEKLIAKENDKILQENYIFYTYLSGGEILNSWLPKNLNSVVYMKNDDLLYARVISAGRWYKREIYNYKADCKLYVKEGIIYQNTTINGETPKDFGFITEKATIEEKVFQDYVDTLSILYIHRISWIDVLDLEKIASIKLFKDNNVIKIEITEKQETIEYSYMDERYEIKTEYYQTTHVFNYVLNINGDLLAYKEKYSSESKFDIVFSFVPYEKTINMPNNFIDYNEGNIYCDSLYLD